ncbi:MAG: hypothetical protein Q8O36_03030 [Candidatus Omnitrophota bacterium]|nr:hypothetical protein [Candidatus Omnitrophota bacterium]
MEIVIAIIYCELDVFDGGCGGDVVIYFYVGALAARYLVEEKGTVTTG